VPSTNLKIFVSVLAVSLLTLLTISTTYVVDDSKPNRVLQESTSSTSASSSSSSTTSSSSSVSASTSSPMVYGENRLVINLDTAINAQRKSGERFILGVQPQLTEDTPVVNIDVYIGFNPTYARITKIIELSNYAAATKNIDNMNGLVKFNATAANGARFTNGQVLFQLEVEVLATQPVFATFNILGNSKLGNPNTVAIDGYGKLDVTLNNPPLASSSVSVFSTISSSSSSVVSSSTTSLGGQFTSGETKVNQSSGVDLRTVITAVLAAIAVSCGIGAALVWTRQRNPQV